jgi:hypothetical protein
MIGKTVKGNGFSGVLRYVFEKPEAQYIGGNMVSSTPKSLACEFRAIANRNSRVQRPVAHIALSPSPEEELSLWASQRSRQSVAISRLIFKALAMSR